MDYGQGQQTKTMNKPVAADEHRRDVSTVQMTFNELFANVENLEKQVAALADRLMPVLALPPANVGLGIEPGTRGRLEPGRGVSDQVRLATARVAQVSERLEELRAHLEI